MDTKTNSDIPKKKRGRPKILTSEEICEHLRKKALEYYYKKIKQDPEKYKKVLERQNKYYHKKSVKVC